MRETTLEEAREITDVLLADSGTPISLAFCLSVWSVLLCVLCRAIPTVSLLMQDQCGHPNFKTLQLQAK